MPIRRLGAVLYFGSGDIVPAAARRPRRAVAMRDGIQGGF